MRDQFITPLFSSDKRSILAALVFAVGLSWLVLALLATPFRALEELSGDWIWKLSAEREPERRVIIVDIDEKSLQALGQWPWPRERIAQLSDKIATAGAALQIYDIVLPSGEKGDGSLIRSLQKNNGILSQIFAIQGNNPVQQGEISSPLDWPACPAVFPHADHHIGNHIAYAALPKGHITPLIGDDGVVRKQPAVICHDGKAFPALFIAAALQGTQSQHLTLASGTTPLRADWQLEGVPLGSHAIPLDAAGNVRIPWLVKPDALIAVSAYQLLSGDIPSQLFDNAWVLIGSTALGVNDRIATPFSGLGAGLQVHAQLLIGLMDSKIPTQPRGDFFIGIGMALIATLLFLIQLGRQQKPIVGLVIGGLLLSGTAYGLKTYLLVKHAIWIEWVGTAAYILILALVLSVFELGRSRFERDRMYAHLTSYLTAPVAAALAVRAPSDAIDAARRDVIVLYADIRNFSAYCEIRPPDETAAVLHAMISAATTVVESHGGNIQAVQGDSILAVWRCDGDAPDSGVGHHAEAALNAAVELLSASHSILPDPDPHQLQSLALGIGLESGPATVGSFGLARRRTHLVMGRAVTIAVRLEEMTVELAHPILIGENLAAYLGPHQLESQGVFLLDGIVSPCHIYAYPLKRCV